MIEFEQIILGIEVAVIVFGSIYLAARIVTEMSGLTKVRVTNRIVTRDEAIKLLKNSWDKSPDPKKVAEEAKRIGEEHYKNGCDGITIVKGKVVQGKYVLAGMILANKPEIRLNVLEHM